MRCLWIVGVFSLSLPLVARAQVIQIDTRQAAIAVPEPLDVGNRDAVTVKIQHLPVLQCRVETKPEPLKPEPNALATILGVATKLFGAGAAACPQPVAPPAGDAEALRIETQLGRLSELVAALDRAKEPYRVSHDALMPRIKNFGRCQKADGSPACNDAAQFRTERDLLVATIEGLLNDVPPSTEAAALLADVVKKSLAVRLTTNPTAAPAAGTGDWQANAMARLDCYSKTLEVVIERRKLLLAARDELRKILDVLATLATPTFETVVALRREHESKVTATATCTNRFTKEVDVSAITFVITYHDRPRLVASAGLLYSFGDKRQIGTHAVRTGLNADSQVTFRTEIAETESSAYQIVPFTFLNWLPIQRAQVDFGLAVGLGLNQNNGGKQIEYMVGPSIGFRNVHLVAGVHRLRRPEPGGGFALGESLPEKFPAVPIRREVQNVLGISLTYKLPF